MAERNFPWSSNVDKSTPYLEKLEKIRDNEGLPTDRIKDELNYRKEKEEEDKIDFGIDDDEEGK